MSGEGFARERTRPRIDAAPALAAVPVVASAIIFLLNTRHGIGVLPDSIGYMQLGATVARYAPLYTWLIDVFSPHDASVVGTAKALGFVLVCANSLLVWRLLARATKSLPATALGAALILSSPTFVHLHSSAMSEPLFLTLLLLSCFIFARLAEAQSGSWAVLGGLAAGAAMLTRFAAAPLLPALLASRLLLPGQPMRRRLIDCAIMAAVGAAPLAAWALYSQLSTGASTGRALGFYGRPDAELWLSGATSLAAMLAPVRFSPALHFSLLAAAIAAASYVTVSHLRGYLAGSSGRATDGYEAVPLLCAAFILFYVLQLIVAVHVEANLPLNARYVLPIYVLAVLMTAISAARRRGAARFAPAARIILAAIAGCVIVSNFTRTALRTADAYADGIGYAGRYWSTSPMLQWVDALPDEAIIYSNAPDLISYRTGRPAQFVPWRVKRQLGQDDPSNPFLRQMEEVSRGLRNKQSYVVFFDRVDWRFYVAPEALLVRELGLAIIASQADGRAYRRAPPP